MALNNKLTTTAALLAASCAFGSVAYADVCDTPSKLGDMGSFPGEVITIQGSMLGTDQEMLLNTVSCFEKATGAKIQYSGSRDFAALVVADMRSNNPPNIAIFPQPGLAADMAAEGHLVPIGDEAAAWMKDNYGAGSSWVDLGERHRSQRRPAWLPRHGQGHRPLRSWAHGHSWEWTDLQII